MRKACAATSLDSDIVASSKGACERSDDRCGVIEIELRSGVRVWVREGADGALLTSVLDAIESLRRLVAAQRSELDAERAARMAVEGALLSRDLLIEKIKVQIARLKRMHFGRSSEKLASEIAQLELALEELETADAELPRLPASPIRQQPRELSLICGKSSVSHSRLHAKRVP